MNNIFIYDRRMTENTNFFHFGNILHSTSIFILPCWEQSIRISSPLLHSYFFFIFLLSHLITKPLALLITCYICFFCFSQILSSSLYLKLYLLLLQMSSRRQDYSSSLLFINLFCILCAIRPLYSSVNVPSFCFYFIFSQYCILLLSNNSQPSIWQQVNLCTTSTPIFLFLESILPLSNMT